MFFDGYGLTDEYDDEYPSTFFVNVGYLPYKLFYYDGFLETEPPPEHQNVYLTKRQKKEIRRHQKNRSAKNRYQSKKRYKGKRNGYGKGRWNKGGR